MDIYNYIDKSKAKWIEVCYLYVGKPGSDESVEVIAKFSVKQHALDFANQLARNTIGPDAIVIR